MILAGKILTDGIIRSSFLKMLLEVFFGLIFFGLDFFRNVKKAWNWCPNFSRVPEAVGGEPEVWASQNDTYQ